MSNGPQEIVALFLSFPNLYFFILSDIPARCCAVKSEDGHLLKRVCRMHMVGRPRIRWMWGKRDCATKKGCGGGEEWGTAIPRHKGQAEEDGTVGQLQFFFVVKPPQGSLFHFCFLNHSPFWHCSYDIWKMSISLLTLLFYGSTFP